VIRELLDAGLMHADVTTVDVGGLRAFGAHPELTADGAGVAWRAAADESADTSVLRRASDPFSHSGGLKLLEGNLGRAVIKVSAVPVERHVVEAPAIVFDSQEALLAAFKAGELERDFVAVVRFQGPRANGMPELHKLTPPLAVLQGKGYSVALVTDGRMSGASGKVPAAIHVSPEALAGGAIGKVQTGDPIRLDATSGTLDVLVSAEAWAARPQAARGAGTPLGAGCGTIGSPHPAANQRRGRSPNPGWGHVGTSCGNGALPHFTGGAQQRGQARFGKIHRGTFGIPTSGLDPDFHPG
jgi:phosphogluconate dehydratase